MKTRYQLVAIAAVTLLLMYAALCFAFSDLMGFDPLVWQQKPWRPMARLVFGVTCVPVILFFSAWTTQALYRTREH
jgi:hypothetical protein